MLKRIHLWQIDWFLVAIAGGIVVIGALFVWSASFRPEAGGEGYYLVASRRHLQWIALAVVLGALTLVIDYHKLLKLADLFYVIGVVVLLGMLAGLPVDNYRRLDFRFIAVQPSEFMKLALILTLAKYLPDRERLQHWRGWLAPVILALCPMVLIVQQPDLGAAMVLVPMLAAMLFAAGARRLHFVVFGAAGALAAGLVVLVALTNPPVIGGLLQDYQKQRIVNFLRPDNSDPGARRRELYQINQSKIAIGAGGLLGRGWGQGTQNRLNFLPYATRHTDFIVAVIAEEAGFVGVNVLLMLFFLLFVLSLGFADRSPDPRARAMIVGIVALMAVQVFINAGSTTGLLPTKGIAMPFVSYGGSSTFVSFMALGLILNVSLHRSSFLAGGNRDELKPLRRILK